MVLKRDCAVSKSEAAKFQGDPGLCWGSSGILENCICFKFRVQPCSGGFACLGSPHSSLATEVEVARCTDCSSKLCRLFGAFWIGSPHIFDGFQHRLSLN